MKLKLPIIFISSIYCLFLFTIGIADFYFERSKVKNADSLKYIDIALAFNSNDSEYYFRKFELFDPKLQKPSAFLKNYQQRISLITRAIDLEPTNPKYHMYYGLELVRDNSLRTRLNDRLALIELRRAAELKPFSPLYRKTLKDYSPSLQP